MPKVVVSLRSSFFYEPMMLGVQYIRFLTPETLIFLHHFSSCNHNGLAGY